eukprot:scaffold83205_cov72-Phaeocystis_antarctica.AAC.3
MSATRCRIGLLPHGACTGCSTCTAMCCSIAHRVLVRRPAASHLGAARRRDEQLGRELHSRYVTTKRSRSRPLKHGRSAFCATPVAHHVGIDADVTKRMAQEDAPDCRRTLRHQLERPVQ